MTEEQQDIVLRNIRLVSFIVKKMCYKYNFDEINDIGIIGLCKGAMAYDSKKGVKESSYLTRCIKNEILMHFRKKDNRMEKISLNTAYQDNSNLKQIELIEMIPDEGVDIEKSLLNQEQTKELYEKILNLKTREMLVICYVYGLCSFPKLSQKKIAEKLGVRQPSISKIKARAIKNLRKELMKE